jgi:hypothetical protein
MVERTLMGAGNEVLHIEGDFLVSYLVPKEYRH